MIRLVLHTFTPLKGRKMTNPARMNFKKNSFYTHIYMSEREREKRTYIC